MSESNESENNKTFQYIPFTFKCYESTVAECNRPRDPANANCDDCCWVCFPITFTFDCISCVPRYIKYKCC